MKVFYLFFLVFFLINCSPPTGLIGVWEVEHQECLFKDNAGIFKNIFKEEEKYILDFNSDNQVKLTYPDLDISAKFVSSGEKQTEENKKLKCDVVIEGSYTYLLSSLRFNFIDDETGSYRIQKGENCDTDLTMQFKSLPSGSFYAGDDPKAVIKKLETEQLYLDFDEFPKCENNKMTVVFHRK